VVAHLSGRTCAAGRCKAVNVEHLFHGCKFTKKFRDPKIPAKEFAKTNDTDTNCPPKVEPSEGNSVEHSPKKGTVRFLLQGNCHYLISFCYYHLVFAEQPAESQI
jgi:hypothetical protein